MKLSPKTWTPFADYVAIQVVKQNETSGGVVLPDVVVQAHRLEVPTAHVIAVGPDCKWAKPGALVLADTKSPILKFLFRGHEYSVIREAHLLGSAD